MSNPEVLWKHPITRRKFLTLGAAVAGLATGSYLFWKDGFTLTAVTGEEVISEKIVRTSGSHNCGGRCLIQVHVRDGRIVRISTEDDIADTPEKPQLRGCLRCRSYRERLYHPDRLKYPMKRAGARGEGKFERITWDEALDTIANHIKRIVPQYGPDAIYLQYATGNAGKVSERVWMGRLMGMYSGYLSYYGSYSTACTQMATPYTYGTANTGNNREDWVNSKIIILLGWNPAETIHGTNTSYYLKKAKAAGAKIISIDPIYSNTAISLADQWIPIRPTTDSALLDAMAYVMIMENLHDQQFLDTYSLGFDEEHMPPGVPAGNSYKSYVLGDSEDHIPKTPAWAEVITGIPQETIIQLAREYATNRPGALIEGYGPQRHAYGEQVVRSGTVLAAVTGNVGVKGGWASGNGYQARGNFVASIPSTNLSKAQISVFSWPDAITRGKGMGPELSVKGVAQLNSNIKMIFNLGGNCLVTQHADNNGTAKILADESLVELLVVSEHFLTPSAKFADILLPADNMMERDDIVTPWGYGDYVLYMNKAVDTVFECRNGYDWISDLASRLNIKEKFTEGRTLEQWMRYLVEETAKKNPGFPTYEEFKAKGVYRWEHKEPAIAFQKQIEDPKNNLFPTPSGKIEIFSPRLWNMKNLREIPAVPKYVAAWEGPEDPIKETYPLQCIGHHYKRRVHSTFDNVGWMEEVGKQEVWVNTLDATERDLKNGDLVKVYNDRGVIVLPVKLTSRIMPGVASVPQGAWWTPDAEGVDRRGSINTLTKYHPTPLAFGNPTHTNLVQITKA
ncbi:anaerobic dimethyl sulfoxide reductase subunit A [Pelosinus fermentans]|uniref:Anaerobic dimethyl sulfoxide reductase, A subunit, DmsA/YnfE family n=1 Tax=Pelosinus fermentans B4 TaxID=1149862 RepID=I9LF21_9FIRM|nr:MULTISPECIES: DMSO/selenate family reductase complex A subunit [Pelosinus]EIW18951.1 anaerobic dimethyl sulfoxide reductase, A subunit, DmsA/YnfE family [Pelosinus fermentans B4]OAM95311.1 anaerobic dimethyl sulfoxide reductase, A subunit, DmsA/YnfE family [Pelosinus fermentans DSM 17108]SDR26270.1 anaerobic dimethyl sulfoxide reductase subunit A [Pelosinus fermentans]